MYYTHQNFLFHISYLHCKWRDLKSIMIYVMFRSLEMSSGSACIYQRKVYSRHKNQPRQDNINARRTSYEVSVIFVRF